MSAPDQPPPANPSLGDRVRSLRLGDREDRSPSRLTYLPWALVVVLLFVSSVLGYRAYRVNRNDAPTESAKAPAKAPAGEPTPEVGPTKPSSSEEVVLQSKGYVVPFSLIQVSPRVGGQLIEINERFREGERFKKGEFLA